MHVVAVVRSADASRPCGCQSPQTGMTVRRTRPKLTQRCQNGCLCSMVGACCVVARAESAEQLTTIVSSLLQAPLLLMGLEEKAIYGEDAEATREQQGDGMQEPAAKRRRTEDAGSDSEVPPSHIELWL